MTYFTQAEIEEATARAKKLYATLSWHYRASIKEEEFVADYLEFYLISI